MPVRQIRIRYLSFRVNSNERFSGEEIADAIQKTVQKLYGIQGLSLVSPNLIKFDEEKQAGVVRCNHNYIRMMRASLAFITDISDHIASIHVNRVSGTLRSLIQH